MYCTNPAFGCQILINFSSCLVLSKTCFCSMTVRRLTLPNTISYLQSEQVAQLGQRDRAKLETISINVQRYLQNHAQNCILGPHYVRLGRNVSALFESFNAKKLCSSVSSRECQFYLSLIHI